MRKSDIPLSSLFSSLANRAKIGGFPKVAPIPRILALALLIPTMVNGCGLLAAPCRIASAGIKIVPVVGHAAALPTDACAAVIDP